MAHSGPSRTSANLRGATPRPPQVGVHVRSFSIAGLMVLAALVAVVSVPSAGASSHGLAPVLSVPSTKYSTIQSAINAASPGATLLVGPGTFVEQLTIHKSLALVGAGAGKTIVQSPSGLAVDSFGNPWTIEVDNGSTVTLTGFTVLVTLQCISPSTLSPDPTGHAHTDVFAGGGIGVGGSARLVFRSSAVTTTGAAEGASCGTGGFQSYGTGVDFGLDHVTGSPAASALLGSGTVSGVSISGFGFGGPAVSVGGQADSPAGSSALISLSRITTSADDFGAHSSPAISVGFGGNASNATIVGNVLSGLASTGTNLVTVFAGSSAFLALNVLKVGPENDAIVVLSSSATISFNSIQGSTADFSGGIILLLSHATISYNTLTDFECAFNSTFLALGLCGPNFASQAQVDAIGDYGDNGLGTAIEHNWISNSDTGILLADGGIALGYPGFVGGCPNCVVKGNTLVNSTDYALVGADGNYTFLKNQIIGGAYGVGALAFATNTNVTLVHVSITKPSAAADYFENDCLAFFGYSCTDVIT